MSKCDEIKLDIEELNTLLNQAQRQRSKDILSVELKKLQFELSKFDDQSKPVENKSAVSTAQSAPKCYEVQLKNYGWDQTDKFTKIYITLKNVHTLPAESVCCTFTERSVEVAALGLENRNYSLVIRKLCEDINISKSHWKVKTDMIVVFLAKQSPKQWSYVTGIEKKIQENKAASTADFDKDQDLEGGVVSLMKKLYQDGNDDMKQMIAKVWTESQEKKSSGASAMPQL